MNSRARSRPTISTKVAGAGDPLHGYASMLAADAQAKGERIDDLEARLDRLEEQLDAVVAGVCELPDAP